MDFQVVVLAGGESSKLVPLVSKEVPKALLPVANRPLLSYVLELLELSNLKNIIVVVEGENYALLVEGWISEAYVDRLHVEVVAVPGDVGTAGALRKIAHHLTANDILVISGDIVSDIPLGAVAATHRRNSAILTAVLCPAPVSGSSESGGKDKMRKPGGCDFIGLNRANQLLLYIPSGFEIKKDILVQKSVIRTVGQMEIRADLLDVHLYAFKRALLQEVLNSKDTFQSLKCDVLPYLIWNQLRSEFQSSSILPISGKREFQADAFPFDIRKSIGSGLEQPVSVGMANTCHAFIVGNNKYCARLHSIQSFIDVNRDVIGEAGHLSGYSFSSHNNIVHPSVKLGSKTTVGPNCLLGEGSELVDKCSVKRSTIGRCCRIGSNVKVVNSVVMNYVTIEDGCSIQGSVICSNSLIQDHVVLRDCQVGAGYVVTAGSECREEALLRKEHK